MEYNEYDKIDVIIDEMEKNKIDDIYYEEINHHFFDTLHDNSYIHTHNQK